MFLKKELNVPNVLSLIRLLLVPVVAVLISRDKSMCAFAVFVFACITDLLDGFIARKYNMITELGSWLDPLADKLMAICLLISFTITGVLPIYVMAVIFTKEIVMVIGGLILMQKKIVIPADVFGKLASLVLNVAIMLSFFDDYVAPFNLVLINIALLLAIVAFVNYLLKALKLVKKDSNTNEQ